MTDHPLIDVVAQAIFERMPNRPSEWKYQSALTKDNWRGVARADDAGRLARELIAARERIAALEHVADEAQHQHLVYGCCPSLRDALIELDPMNALVEGTVISAAPPQPEAAQEPQKGT